MIDIFSLRCKVVFGYSGEDWLLFLAPTNQTQKEPRDFLPVNKVFLGFSFFFITSAFLERNETELRGIE